MIKARWASLLAVCTIYACADTKVQSTSGDEALVLQAELIAESVGNTPYSARVRITHADSVRLAGDDPSGDYAEQMFVYHVKVMETLRGEPMEEITYSSFSEAGESADVPDVPVIITLCRSEDGFYWPGVGAMFDDHATLAAIARNVAAQVDPAQETFGDCE